MTEQKNGLALAELQRNRRWADSMVAKDPNFFKNLKRKPRPNTCGSAAPTAAFRPTNCWAWRLATCSCTVISPTWSCIPT
jgi:hypothetical protein